MKKIVPKKESSVSEIDLTAWDQRCVLQTDLSRSRNAGAQPLPEAGATQERTLEAVGCSAWFSVAHWHRPSLALGLTGWFLATNTLA